MISTSTPVLEKSEQTPVKQTDFNESGYAVVGKNVIKKDALDKVLGKAKFAADYYREGMIYGGVFRSSIPHGIVKKLDVSVAESMTGVVAVLRSHDIPGKNRFGIIIKDEPALVDDKIRRIGDPLVLIGAESEEILQKALDSIEVEYEELEAVLSFDRALEEDAPRVHGDSNVHIKKKLVSGDSDEAFKHCDVIVENTYRTASLTHMFIEPDAGISYKEDGVLTISASTQNPHYDRDEVAALLGIPRSKVRVKQATTGGAFGGKLDLSVQCHLALLTHHTGRPAKMVRARKESTLVSSKRHPMTMHAKTGATRDGKLLAMEVTMTADTGAYASYGPAVATRAMVHCTGPYVIPNVKVESLFIYSNNPMCGAFRGFGVPQVAVCHEGQMNALAKELGMDPVEIRRINAHRVGSTIPTGQVLNESVGLLDTIDQALQEGDQPLYEKGTKKYGKGIGCMWYGIGNTGLPNPAAAFIEILGDCSVNLSIGAADIGQGSTTVMAQIASEELGIPYENINVTFADTKVTPEGGATSASRQTFITGNAVINAAKQAKGILFGVAAEYLSCTVEELMISGYAVCSREEPELSLSYPELMLEAKKRGRLAIGAGSYNPKTTYLDPETMAGEPYEVYSYATTLAEVAVDTETGEVDVMNVTSAHDVGQPVNLAGVEGQIEGGVAMGEGFAIMEECLVNDGRIMNTTFSKYLIPTSMDVPEIKSIAVCSEGAAGPFGAKGVGEPALIPSIPAITAAIENALGVRFTTLPITPQRILEALEAKQANS